MALQMQPNFLASILGGAPEIDQGPMDLSGVLQNANVAPIAPGIQQAPQQAPSPRGSGRRSVLDIVGGLGDVFATVGGATAQYRPQVDARTERARQVDLDEMRRQQFELQQRTGEQGLKLGDQKFQAGEMEIDEAQRGLLGQATRGLAAVYERGGAPALQKAWPMLSQQLGIDPEQAEIFGQSLAADPEGTLTALNAALTDPAKAGSQAKERQVVAMLDERDPTGALTQQYLRSVATGQDVNEAERNEIQRYNYSTRNRYNDRRQAWAENPNNPRNQPKPVKGDKGGPPSGEAIASARDVLGQLRTELTTLRDNGGINAKGQSGAQRIGAFAKENLPLVERVTSPNGFSARQRLDGLLTQGVFSLIPVLTGATLGGKSFDAKAEMDNLKKVIASASDYDAAMRGLQAFENKINRLEFNGTSAAPARGGNRAAPRQRPAGKLSPRGGPSVSNW